MSKDLKVGYVVTTSTKQGFVGAIMVSDEKGFPIEFQYTEPILPTKLQKVLYGNSLEKYLKIDVILDNLVNVLNNNIDLLIVKDEQLLEYKQRKIDIVRVAETNFSNNAQTQFVKIKDDEYVIQYSKTSAPVKITFSNDVNEQDEIFIKVVDTVRQVGMFIDITEPLLRVQKSIDVILSKDTE